MNKKTKSVISVGLILATITFFIWIINAKTEQIPYEIAIASCKIDFSNVESDEFRLCLEKKGFNYDAFIQKTKISYCNNFEGKQLCDCLEKQNVELICPRGDLDRDSCSCILKQIIPGMLVNEVR